MYRQYILAVHEKENMTILEFKNVSKKYGKHEVLSGVSFQLKSNRIVGLLGPNGSGKTTIMKIISGLISPTCGEVMIPDNIKIKAQIENPVFYRGLSGLDNLLYLTSNEKEVTKSEIISICEQLNMGDYIRKKTGKYSMGMRERLSVAYMLVGNANLIVLDEPFNGLDPIAVIEVRNILQELVKKKNVTIFISSHILKELQCFCNEIIVLNNGKMIEHTVLQDMGTVIEIEYETEEDCIEGCSILNIISKTNLKSELRLKENDKVSDIVKKLVDSDVKITSIKKKDNIIEEIYCQSIMGCENVKS